MEKILLENPWIIILILLWTLPWKAAALWRSARRGHVGWFLTIIILNTLGILDILYIFIFSRLGKEKKQEEDKIPEIKSKWTRFQQEESTENDVQVRQSQFSSNSKSRQTIV
ncbi:MAG: hypothetical protein US25_C0014G0011 [Candidatus Moranbacteria bacterium GW2011_GWE1_36_7]|nr:MAG: hypothetical protein UR99_C0054G0004 [Candidatus Moranbacteria bacterium GW2011_GWD2_36_12]KKQ06507.1 MAG: hypothetical protein US16_C0015G0004 [Candidatus Moranbacteria bacterium GW2011_GWE2_36_40]KKQ15083.1 MAG: hypothetical protein US25_C0014G0011 [Candidatus Moranbacteria bacterium GW2011_GWE1_36_7]